MVGEGWAGRALAAARPSVFWSDSHAGPQAAPQLTDNLTADLTIVGGGFTGLWTAVQALEESPGLEVVLLEAEHCGFGASSRNGGFCDASLTHGVDNGLHHWPDDIDALVRLGRENLDGIAAGVDRYGIDAGYAPAAETWVATKGWHLENLKASLETHRSVGERVELLDAPQMRGRINSPTFLGGLIRHDNVALVDPARFGWGLRAAAESLGVRLFELTPAVSVEADGAFLKVVTPRATVRTRRVVSATNAYRGPMRRPRRYIIPVYDHVLVTEPLSSTQLASVGWHERDGVGDGDNEFHYYRLTDDDRILWGGYGATYHFGNGVRPEHDLSRRTHAALAEHFFETFPQLEGLRFTHRWGGPIGTTTHFAPAWGSLLGGRFIWVGGYTGLGVGSSRFGARVALDLVFGNTTERTELAMVRNKPVPFPPEPLRWSGVQLTRRAIQRSDRRGGERGAWLKLLDRFGIGFDS